ncbi:hypothetical protein [Armatimonas sp.]|uniref:hypothetical protein n=1 Tax=Armatimonas sp. TaxID=1872638 RepID=UPI00374CD80F
MSKFYVANLSKSSIYKEGFSDFDTALIAACSKHSEVGGQIVVVEVVGSIEPVSIVRTSNNTLVMAGGSVLGEMTPHTLMIASPDQMTVEESIQRAA